MTAMKKSVCTNLKNVYFGNIFQNSVVLEANRLEQKSGATNVGPDLGSSLFSSLQKYKCISIPNRMG